MMPDYGCPVQAWTIYAVATPLITHIFGVSPDAYHKQVVFEPHLPAGWNRIALSNLRVGDNAFSIEITENDSETVYDISSRDEHWNYILRLPDASGNGYVLNGEKTTPRQDGAIPLTGKRNRITVHN
jgi:hypothetical protein